MITLTAPITIPNVTRLRVVRVLPYDDAAIAVVKVEALSPGATPRSKSFDVRVTNTGTTEKLKKNPAPSEWGDDVTFESFSAPATGYDQVEAAYRSGGTKAAALRAVEQKLIDLGYIDATLTGTVS